MTRLAAAVAWIPLGAVAYATDSAWLWLAAVGALVAIAVDAVVRHEIRQRRLVEPVSEPVDPWPHAWPEHPMYAPTVYLPVIEEAGRAR